MPQDWRAQSRGQQHAEQSWDERSADQWRAPAQREPVDSWRAAEPEPVARRQWGAEPEPRARQQCGGEPEPRARQQQCGGEQRYGHPPQEDSPRAGGRWR